jgi:hypothetical protein
MPSKSSNVGLYVATGAAGVAVGAIGSVYAYKKFNVQQSERWNQAVVALETVYRSAKHDDRGELERMLRDIDHFKALAVSYHHEDKRQDRAGQAVESWFTAMHSNTTAAGTVVAAGTAVAPAVAAAPAAAAAPEVAAAAAADDN